MLAAKDRAFITFLIEQTNNGQIRWEPTASPDQFTTSLRGKYNVVVDKTGVDHFVKMSDGEGRELLHLTDDQDPAITRAFEAARRAALNVDGAIDEILGG